MGTATNITGGMVFLLALGVSGLVIGVLMHLGIWKLWFVVERVPVLVIPSFAYGSIPVGLAFLILGISIRSVSDPSNARTIFFCVVFPLFMTSIAFAIWQPSWLQPNWYRWLEKHHGSVIPILKKEAQAMGRWKWQRRVRTQEGLEQWVEEVRRKHGL